MPRKEEFNLEFRPKGYGKGAEWVIATIALPQTVRADIIEVRARKRSGKYHYEIIDDDGIKYPSRPRVSERPLSLGQLIVLIDGASGTGYDDQPAGLTSVFRDYSLEDSSDGPEALVDFVIVTSTYYVDLERWYKEEAQEWLDAQLAKRAAEHAEDEAEMNRVRKLLLDFEAKKNSKGRSK